MGKILKLLFLAMSIVILAVLLESAANSSADPLSVRWVVVLFTAMLILLFMAIYPFGKSR